MKSNAFSAGVNPGGLRSLQEIKLLICYILSTINAEIKKSDLISALQNAGISNYFETSEAFSDLISNKNLVETAKEEIYKVSESGKVIAEQLSGSLPHSVKIKSLEAINSFIKTEKSRSENTVKIEKSSKGYNVTCNISSDEKFDLMSFTIYVPEIEQAAKVKRNFYKNPGIVYRTMLALLTHNKELLQESLSIFSNRQNS